MPIESSSNWDFTPVINLLRSPTYDGGDFSVPSRHSEDHASSLPSGEKLRGIINGSDCESHSNGSDEDYTTPRLGDFGSLWDILGQGTATASAKVEHLQDSDTTPHPRSLQSSTPTKILKRTLNKLATPEISTQDFPRTPPKSIPGPNTPKSCHIKGQVNDDNKQFKAAYEASSSDGTAEAESDGNLSIFDSPFSKPRDALSSKPSQAGTPLANSELYDSPPSSFDELDGSLVPVVVKKPPNAYKLAKKRRNSLLTKLRERFPDYGKIVSQIGQPVNTTNSENPSSRPIHVFVDISNIMVGFHDSFKLSHNIPVKTRIRRLPLSFQNFSFILERGRPITKRVLVGSDRFAAIDEGEKLGYETNILDRVHKVKQLTRRQVKFRKSPRVEAVSSSETNDMAGERWVEQGVDEILHLKILESLLDTDEPATIVLATGDAAEAEYSGGFMRMVERALQRGWVVELVSFSQVTSQAYRRKEFRAKWGSQFKMIALNEYIEELLAV